MLQVLVFFNAFLRSYVLSALRLVNRHVFRFQIDYKRSELPDYGQVDSEPSEFPADGEHSGVLEFPSESIEMGDKKSNGKTRNSVFRSVSMETVSSLKMGNSDNYSVGCIQAAALDGDPEKKKDIFDSYGVSEGKNLRIIESEYSVSNMFDSLPEPEVQVLWEDYSMPSDSESEPANSTNGSPKINHQVDSSSREEKADVTVEKDKRLQSHNNLAQEEEEFVDSSEKSTGTKWQEQPSTLNFDYRYELNYLPDHKDIIQQLEVELRNTRTGGLPTIFEEETETTEVIDEKRKYEEGMGEIQEAYKTYAEKMWKLDILNNQSMHAIGLLQLKYPVQSISVQKSLVPTSKSPRPWSGKARRLTADPRLEFLGDLQRDMELVYVGQVCLSWEILQWQLRKVLELQRYDSESICQFHQVACEFQLFQVLLKRFMEDERFQGQRVENYVQNRCVFRSLLQVPVVKDDGFAEGKGREWENEDGFSSKILGEIMEKTTWVFYQFLLADKGGGKNMQKSIGKDQIELRSSEKFHLLLVNVKAHFQKVDRKLKGLVRSSNSCSVEKLAKEEEAGLSYALILLIAQVELKLISRVLKMSKLTMDQLSWCSQKLDQITFVDRKVELVLRPSFLPFPI